MNEPDFRSMRQAIHQASRGLERVDGKPLSGLGIPPAAPLVRNILHAANYAGLSGEDTMTWLAFEALKGYELFYDQLLEHAMLTPSKTFPFAEAVAETMRKR
jgi:hypothetical protein